jgi:hypothetical protein
MEGFQKKRRLSKSGMWSLLPDEVWVMIFGYVFARSEIERFSLFCVCKWFEQLLLTYIFPPSKGRGLEWAIEHGYFEYFQKWTTPQWVPSSQLMTGFFNRKKLSRNDLMCASLLLEQGVETPTKLLEYSIRYSKPQVFNLAIKDWRTDPNRVLNVILDDHNDVWEWKLVRRLTNEPLVDSTLRFLAACRSADWELVETLFEHHGVDFRAKDDLALFCASHFGQVKLMKRLLNVPEVASGFLASLEAQEALFKAAVTGVESLKIALAFASQEASLEHALMEAARQSYGSRGEVVRLLLQDPRMTAGILGEGFFHGCRSGDLDTVRVFLEDERFSPTEENHQSLENFIASEDTTSESACAFLRLLVDDGRIDMHILLFRVAERGFVEAVRLLIYAGVHPGFKRYSALRIACFCGHVEVVHLLLDDPRTNISRQVQKIARSVRKWDDGSKTENSKTRCNDILRLLIKHHTVLPLVDEGSIWSRKSKIDGSLHILCSVDD